MRHRHVCVCPSAARIILRLVLALSACGAVYGQGFGTIVGTVTDPSGAIIPATVTVSTNGSRQNQVSFRLDGSNNNDLYTNSNQPFPFPDALQEFSVQTSNYSARYGGNAGGVVNVVTRSGSNELHGSLLEFNRNAVFNARNFFAAKRDQLKRNQYGGTVGGPIKIPHVYDGSNKDFFFFGYQGTKIRNIGGTSSAYAPLASNLTGDFSNVLSATDPANPFGKATQVVDPVTNLQFPGNKIPLTRLDPAALAFTKYIPVSSAATTASPKKTGCPSATSTTSSTTRASSIRPTT